MTLSITRRLFLREFEVNKYFDFNTEFDFEIHKKLVFWGVRSLAKKQRNIKTKEHLYREISLYQLIIDLVGKLTPNQLINLFPINKTYDGDKYEMKDYFYTIDMCKEHGLDNPIEEAFEFLWDYMNNTTGFFLINYMSLLSDLMKMETGQGSLETYAAEMGLKTYKRKVINGKEVFVENLTFNSKGELI